MLLGIMPANAFAEDQVTHNSKEIIYVPFSKNGNKESKEYCTYSSGKTVKVKVSNSSVASVSFKNSKQRYGTCVSIKFKKAGTVKVTQTYISGSSKRVLTKTFKTVPYKSPVKSLKIGKTDLTKKVKNSYNFTGKSFSGKVSFKLNKGWKFDRMYKFKTSQLNNPSKLKQIGLKKNKAFKLRKGERLVIRFKKGNTTQNISYTVK
jgi:hypothetical protein